ncbi:MAG: hypothetical protein H0W88_09870 [Parachlamydiaceae bacterium]|nr:hypothetical protein [Parachlamydiaceae bacterium]
MFTGINEIKKFFVDFSPTKTWNAISNRDKLIIQISTLTFASFALGFFMYRKFSNWLTVSDQKKLNTPEAKDQKETKVVEEALSKNVQTSLEKKQPEQVLQYNTEKSLEKDKLSTQKSERKLGVNKLNSTLITGVDIFTAPKVKEEETPAIVQAPLLQENGCTKAVSEATLKEENEKQNFVLDEIIKVRKMRIDIGFTGFGDTINKLKQSALTPKKREFVVACSRFWAQHGEYLTNNRGVYEVEEIDDEIDIIQAVIDLKFDMRSSKLIAESRKISSGSQAQDASQIELNQIELDEGLKSSYIAQIIEMGKFRESLNLSDSDIELMINTSIRMDHEITYIKKCKEFSQGEDFILNTMIALMKNNNTSQEKLLEKCDELFGKDIMGEYNVIAMVSDINLDNS